MSSNNMSNNNHHNIDLQFTELTLADIMTHEKLYMDLIRSDKTKSLYEKGAEMIKARTRFRKMFE